MKKGLSIILAAVLLISVLPLNVFAISRDSASNIGDTFNVAVPDIESIEIEDVECIENYDGYMSGYWDENDNYIENSWFEYDVYPDNITVNFTDGSFISGEVYEIAEYTGSYPYCDSDQSYENQWGLGNHTATINIFGYEQNYTVKVVETPVQSILVDDITYIEGTNGWVDHDTENPGWYCYDINPEELTVILKNGDEISGTLNEVCEQLGCWQNCTSDQSYNNQWSIGEHKATIDLLGVTAEYKIIITESPVQSLEISDISIIEKSAGWEEDGVFHYYNFYPDCTITMKDGSVVNYDGIEIDGEWYSISIDNSIQYNEPWTVGNTYEVAGSILGVSDTFNVTITESPIESIEIKDISIIECSEGYYEDGTFFYYEPSLFATVTFEDGTTKDIDSYLEIEGTMYYFDTNMWDMQSEQPWTVGTYTVTGALLGVSDTFNVTIIESPVASITFKDVVLIEGIDSYDDGDYLKYSSPSILSEVILKNGTKSEIIDDKTIIYNGKYCSVTDNALDLQYEQYWTVGTYTVTGALCGVTATFDVTIIENPIEELQVIKKPDKREYLQGEQINLKGMVIRIQYADGSYEDVTIEEDYTSSYHKRFYSKKLDRTCYIDAWIDPEIIGQQNVGLDLFGKTCEFPITVRENLMESISIKENADKSITIKVTNSDNTSYDMNLLDITRIWGSHEGEYYGTIFTDYGEFNAVIYADEDSFAIGINLPADHIKSNIIPGSDWFKAVVSAYGYSWNMACNYDMEVLETQHFSGEITIKNFDDIVSFAAYLLTDNEDYNWWVSPEGVEYMVYAGKDVRDAMKKLFGIENIDLTLSQNYDSETDTYKTTKYPRMGDEWSKASPSKITYNNGVWEIESSHYWYDETVVHLKLNNDQQIISFDINDQNVKHTVGDIDGDNEITDWDGVLLARYLAGWNVEITTLDALDIDGDGEITDWDGVVLDRYLAGWNVSIG